MKSYLPLHYSNEKTLNICSPAKDKIFIDHVIYLFVILLFKQLSQKINYILKKILANSCRQNKQSVIFFFYMSSHYILNINNTQLAIYCIFLVATRCLIMNITQ